MGSGSESHALSAFDASAFDVQLACDAEWSVRVVDAACEQGAATLFEHESERVLKTASIGKLFMLIDAAARIERGDLDPDEPLTRTEADAVADSGLWYLLAAPTLSVRDACSFVGAVSDNLATNVLVRRLGIDAIAAVSRGLGFTASALLDRVRDDRGPLDPPTLSRGNASELAELLRRLHCGDIVSPTVSKQVLDWIAVDTDLSMVAAAFGLDPLAHIETDRGILLRNKTGTIDTARGDVGVVSGPAGAIAYAMLANWNDKTDARDAVLVSMREIGDAIRQRIGA